MKYSNFIKANKEFQSAINIQYDLGNLEKIESYIPTSSSMKILKDFLANIYYGTKNNASLLVGPYGKGKSHLLLILLTLLYHRENNNYIINELLNRIENVDSECAKIAKAVYKNKKYLPVIINFNSDNLNQAFLIAINNSLNMAGLSDILPDTYFDSAMEVINGWKEYKNTIKKFKLLIKEKGIDRLSQLEKRLRLFDKEAYDIFKYAFKEITSGIDFNPLLNTDIVKMYDEVNYNLKEKYNYDGIIIVFDEFSKFIESSSENNNIKDLKILQDIAELCNRASNPQMNLICITHKTINEYISKIPENKVDAWRTIEGRFVEKYFVTDSNQNYEMISNAIQKDSTKFNKFLDKNKEILLSNNTEAQDLFGKIQYDEYIKQIVLGCFPLSPYVAYALPIISEKVAQNERTLFTYLCKYEPYSLMDFVEKNEGSIEYIGFDSLYDYFEILFKKEIFNEQIHNTWLMVDACLKIVNDEIDKNILKTIGIIYIINNFQELSPTLHNLCNILDYNQEDIKNHLNDLIDIDNILYIKKSNYFIDFMPISTVNITKKIKDLVAIKFNKPNISKVLNSIRGIKYELPRQYNFEYKITRYFNRIFMTVDEVLSYTDSEQILNEYGADGVIIDLIYFNDSEKQTVKYWKERVDDDKIMVTIPNQPFGINEYIAQYEAVNYLYSDMQLIKQDNRIISQLDLLKDDLQDIIKKYIDKYYDFYSKNYLLYINSNREMRFLKSNHITTLLSQMCKENFANSPIINNELINKNTVSTPVKKARDFIVELILSNKLRKFDYKKNSLECTLYRATIKNTGILDNKIAGDVNNLLQVIRSFVCEAQQNSLSFSELYHRLQSNELGLGIRRGIIPIYLSIVLHEFADNLVIYFKSGRKKNEAILDVNCINNINESPQLYEIELENGSIEMKNYINNLYKVFVKKAIVIDASANKYIDIVKGMQNWYQSLSLFTKNHLMKIDISKNYKEFSNIDTEIIKLRKYLVKYDLNCREFLIKTLPNIINSDNYDEIYEQIVKIKLYLDNRDNDVNKYLIDSTKSIILKEYEGSLSGALKSWYMSLRDDQKKHLFSSQCNKFMDMCSSDLKGDIETVQKLALIFTNLNIQDWNDLTFNIYFDELKQALNEIDNFAQNDKQIDCDNITIQICKDGIKSEEKSFYKEPISVNGTLLLNEIENAIDEFNDSVEDNEKRNILLNLLQKYI